MKNFLITILVLIIAGVCVWFICHTRANAVEHYACTSTPGAVTQSAAAGVAIDMPRRIATLTGGPRAGTYTGLEITPDQVTWQKNGDFTFNRHDERLIVLWSAGNVTYQSTAQCEPQSLSDRLVTLVD